MLRPAMFLGKLDDRSSPPESEDLATTRLPLAKTPPSHWSVPRRGAAIMLLDAVGNSKVAPFAGSGTPSVAPRLCPASNQEGESIPKTI